MRQEQSDWQLLKEYVEQGSQEAFAVLVERHVNFVYSTCLREVHEAVLAEDVTQVVFLILARKAPGLQETGTLSGWLYKTSCFASKNALKQERGRRRREQNAMQELIEETGGVHNSDSFTPDDNWAQMEERLHEALSSLNVKQRDIIFLRFFEGKSVRETGEALGITEKAAEGRLARALEKMRHTFEKSGYIISAFALASLLTNNAVQAAPAACTSTMLQLANTVAAGGTVAGSAIGGTAVGLASGITAPANVVSLSQGVLKAMLISQIKTGVVASLAVSMMATSAVKFAHFARADQLMQKLDLDIVSSVPVKMRFASRKAPPNAPKKYLIQSAQRTPWTDKNLLIEKMVPSAEPQKAFRTAPRPMHRTLLAQASDPATSERQSPQTLAALPKPNAGEIAIEGTISGIGSRRLIIDVAAFTLPNGKTSLITPPKPKIVLIDEATVIHARGQATVLVPFKGLREGVSVLIFGADKGSGEALPARSIAVWDRVQNGIYIWKGQLGGIPESSVPQAATEEFDITDVPPDDVEKRNFPNQFPQGDFQKTIAGQIPDGWVKNSTARVRIQEKNGKRWLAITSTTKSLGTIKTDVPLHADWQRVRISAQMKAKNLKRGTTWWHVARLDFHFYDTNNKVLQYGRGLNIYESSDWKKISNNVAVPKGAAYMRLEAGLFFSTGELLIDNIRLEANTPIEARPLLPGFPEGKFEKIDDSGWPDGFEPLEPGTFEILEEKGNHFIRLASQPPGGGISLNGHFAWPPEWKAVRVRARVRLKDYVPGKNSWDVATIALTGEDEMGKIAGDYWKWPQAKPTDDWKTIEVVNAIDAGTKIIHVQPQLWGASGTFDVDDIEILDATNDELPSLPILPNLPGGTFEVLDNQGWPVGWETEASKQNIFQIVEEKGNHYLRLKSNDIIYAATKSRFKLPRDWRALKLKGRLRVKNLKEKPDAKVWETARVGFMYQTKQGARTGGFPPSLELHADTDWKQLELKSDIPPEAVYIELAAIFNNAGGIFDVDDLTIEQAVPERILKPVYEWTRTFPEGSFDHLDDQGNPLNWPLSAGAQIGTEDGNNFLRLTNNEVQSTVLSSSQWKVKPEWKAVRVRARMRASRLKFGTNPLDGARLQILFLDATENVLNPLPAPLEMKRDADWKDLQTQCAIPPGAVAIKLVVALARTSGTLDVDDILIEPLDIP